LAGRAPGFAGDFAAKGRPAANASGVAKGCFRPPRSVTQIAASDPKPPLDVAGGRPESGPSLTFTWAAAVGKRSLPEDVRSMQGLGIALCDAVELGHKRRMGLVCQHAQGLN